MPRKSQNSTDPDEIFFGSLLLYIGKGKVVLLEAYFDESERENGLLCVAGYVFSRPQMLKLAREFRATFGPYGGFHMKDVVHKRRGYKGISDPERDRLVRAAVDIVKRRFSYGVAVTVNRHEYEAQAPKGIRGLENAYPFLCHMAMLAVADLTAEHDDPEPISYFFEAGHRYQAEAHFAAAQIPLNPELMKQYRYRLHAFMRKDDAVAFQAADLLAWEAAKFKDETEDQNLRAIRLSLLSLFQTSPKRYKVAFCGGATLTRTLKAYQRLAVR